jgi:hypothetical protein
MQTPASQCSIQVELEAETRTFELFDWANYLAIVSVQLNSRYRKSFQLLCNESPHAQLLSTSAVLRDLSTGKVKKAGAFGFFSTHAALP